MGYTKAADGKTWRKTSDNSVVNPDSPNDPFPKSEYTSAQYPVATANWDYFIVYHGKTSVAHGKIINYPETKYYSICEIPVGDD